MPLLPRPKISDPAKIQWAKNSMGQNSTGQNSTGQNSFAVEKAKSLPTCIFSGKFL
jgi:hypothetical protein